MFYITLFVLFCWLVVSNLASVLKMDYNHVVATVASYLYAGTTLMQYSCNLWGLAPALSHTSGRGIEKLNTHELETISRVSDFRQSSLLVL